MKHCESDEIELEKIPNVEVKIKYLILQRYLDYCHTICRCYNECIVWLPCEMVEERRKVSYIWKSEFVDTCPHMNMRKAFHILERIIQNCDYIPTVHELELLESIVQKRLKAKIVRV
ncbi:MAG: hypothetical protein QXR76_03230 [Candidatus Bathyarchaeia archaeon]